MITLIRSLVSALKAVFTLIGSVVSFVINTISNLVNFLAQIPRFVSYLLDSVFILPSIITQFALACISIFVILRLLNRSKT